MGRRAQPVKGEGGRGPRDYDATGRRLRAARTRQTLVDAAERRFLTDGYASTTIAAVAADAGVSVDTVYKSFGGKPGLIRAIRDRALAGRGPVHAEQRSEDAQASAPDGRAVIESWGALTAEVAPLVAPILLLIRDAATSTPEVAELQREVDADRHRRMTDNARRLRDAGHLRRGIRLSDAADVLWTYSSPELYELLVVRRGWSPDRYGRFVAEAMIAALL